MRFKLILMKQRESKSRIRRLVWWMYKLWNEDEFIRQDARQNSHGFHRPPWQNYPSCFLVILHGTVRGNRRCVSLIFLLLLFLRNEPVFSILPSCRFQTHPLSLSSLSPRTRGRTEISFPRSENFISWKIWHIFQEIFVNTLKPAKTLNAQNPHGHGFLLPWAVALPCH